MPRLKGTKVIFCKKCEGRVVGMPGQQVTCSHCGAKNTIPKGKKT